jgi:predicted rRNA methylase YqxC with S4 and FtsJ domains
LPSAFIDEERRPWAMRVDVYLTKHGYVGSRTRAQQLIAKGSVTITANDDGTHTATFLLEDDAFNKITGNYTGVFIVEDFR